MRRRSEDSRIGEIDPAAGTPYGARPALKPSSGQSDLGTISRRLSPGDAVAAGDHQDTAFAFEVTFHGVAVSVQNLVDAHSGRGAHLQDQGAAWPHLAGQ